jgi:hypothetical protein
METEEVSLQIGCIGAGYVGGLTMTALASKNTKTQVKSNTLLNHQILSNSFLSVTKIMN